MTMRSDIDDLLDGRLLWSDLVARLRLDDDEERLFRSYLRRAGLRAREHIADHRASVAASLLAGVPNVPPDPGDEF